MSDGKREYKSFYKTAGGGEGERCKYPTRLDTYGCGCQHDCDYCYAKSLLDFRNLWDAQNPAVADIEKIRRRVKKLERGSIVRLGGMTDCFMPLERRERVTYETIKELNKQGVGYLIVTKSDMVADDDYIGILDPELAHIQISVTTTSDDLYRQMHYEKAPPPSARVRAILKLQSKGYDVALRLSPLIEEYVDFAELNGWGIEKCQVEFQRINTWIERWFKGVDFSAYELSEGGYKHLPLQRKIDLLGGIKIPNISVCEDVDAHYIYWKKYVNPNKEDCCNLRRKYE